PRWPESTGCGSTWTVPTAGAAYLRRAARRATTASRKATPSPVDPHKWLFAPFDSAALLYRNPSVARSVHKQNASYLDVIHDRPGEWNPTDYASKPTKRAPPHHTHTAPHPAFLGVRRAVP